MFVVTVDQRDSRSDRDRVPDALRALGERVPGARLPFERTAGDEIQGTLATAEEALEAVVTLTRLRGWSVGVGVGEGEMPLPASTRAARGPVYVHAREAVEAARRRRAPRLCVRGERAQAAAEAEALMRLLATILEGRSEAAWQAADLVYAGATQAEAARRLGITRQAVGQRLAAGRVDVERAARPVVARLLAAADA